jgi:hypothetical protein
MTTDHNRMDPVPTGPARAASGTGNLLGINEATLIADGHIVQLRDAL